MDLTIQQLRMLREVAEQGTIGAAAAQLGYTASAVSQQLAGVERVTGVPVLERVGRNVFLTDAGRELVSHAALVLAQLEEAKASVERVTQRAAGTLRVGMIESVASTMVPLLLPRLAEGFPDLTIRTRQVDPDLAVLDVRSGDLDLAFTVAYPNAPVTRDDRLERTLVCRDWFKVVVRDDDPIVDDVVELEELAGRPMIASPPDMACGRCILVACRDAGFEPDIAHKLDDYPTVLHLVAAGAGVGLVPDLGLRSLPEGVRAVTLKAPVCRTVDLVWRASSRERPAVTAFISTVESLAEELGLDR